MTGPVTGSTASPNSMKPRCPVPGARRRTVTGVYVIELAFDSHPRRLEARPAHRELLATLHAQGQLVVSGPWHDDSGALLVFDVDQTGVDQIIAQDPYYATPGVTVVSVRRLNAIFGPAGPAAQA